MFREIRKDLSAELKAAKERLNLTIVLASHRALVLEKFKDVRPIEQLWWEGIAILIPCDQAHVDQALLRDFLKSAFPVLSLAESPNIIGPIRSASQLVDTLNSTLLNMRSAVKSPEIEKKDPKDTPPSIVDANPGVRI